MLSLAAPGLYPSPERFTRTYRRPIESGERPELLDRLRARVRPAHAAPHQGAGSPGTCHPGRRVLAVPLTPHHERIYARHLQRRRAKVLGLPAGPGRQPGGHPALADPAAPARPAPGPRRRLLRHRRSAKVELLVEMLVELCLGGSPRWSSAHDLPAPRPRTAHRGGRRPVISTAGPETGRPGSASSAEGTAPAFLISLQGRRIRAPTLTEADYVRHGPVVESRSRGPGGRPGAPDRAGQTRHGLPVVSAGTIEEKVVRAGNVSGTSSRVVDGGSIGSGCSRAADIAALLDPPGG